MTDLLPGLDVDHPWSTIKRTEPGRGDQDSGVGRAFQPDADRKSVGLSSPMRIGSDGVGLDSPTDLVDM
jgi:hypothetical protein